jgi:hypothetical protein
MTTQHGKQMLRIQMQMNQHKLRKMVGTLGHRTLLGHGWGKIAVGLDLVVAFLEGQGGVEVAGTPIQSFVNDLVQCD